MEDSLENKEKDFIGRILTQDFIGPYGQKSRSRLINMGNGYLMRVHVALGNVAALMRNGYAFSELLTDKREPIFWYEIYSKRLNRKLEQRFDILPGHHNLLLPYYRIAQAMGYLAAFPPHPNRNVRLSSDSETLAADAAPAYYFGDVLKRPRPKIVPQRSMRKACAPSGPK